MALVSKLLGLWLTERTVASTTPVFMRLLAAIAAIAVFTALASALFVLFIGGLLWLVYDQLHLYGLTQPMTLYCMLALVVILLAIVSAVVRRYTRQIEGLSSQLMVGQGPLSGSITSVADAFVRGLQTPSFTYRIDSN